MNNFVILFAIISCSFCITNGAPRTRCEPQISVKGIVDDLYKNIASEECDAVAPRNCQDIYDSGIRVSGIYVIYVGTHHPTSIRVYCHMNMSTMGGGWTVILKRREILQGKPVDFSRSWNEYAIGFGEFNKEYMMGLNHLHQLTNSNNFELFIGMQNHGKVVFKTTECDVYKYSRYSKFSIGSLKQNYALRIGDYDTSSTAGDSLTTHNNVQFSTIDRDNDGSKAVHCAETHSGGWWYNACRDAHLTGINFKSGSHISNEGIEWSSWNKDYSLQSVIMAIRPLS